MTGGGDPLTVWVGDSGSETRDSDTAVYSSFHVVIKVDHKTGHKVNSL